MGNFKNFLNEEDYISISLDDIRSFLGEMSEEEIDELGMYLISEFFEVDDNDIEEEIGYDIDDVMDMIEELGEEFYPYIYDMLSIDDSELEDDNDSELEEGVSRIMSVKNINRKKRKFMKKSAAQLRKEAPKRRIEMRKTFAKRKRYMNANRNKIAQYQSSREKFIKKGTHHIKLRKKSGNS